MFAASLQQIWDEVIQRSGTTLLVAGVMAVLSFLLGRWWGKRRARREWEGKQFLGLIHISLNILADGWLKIRTVFERSLEEVFLNPYAVAKVRDASLRTTPDNAILPIPPDDRWYLLNFVLNAVSERFSSDTVLYDAGKPLRPVTYLIFLTCEVVGPDRIRKVRAMMVRKEVLESFPYTDSLPQMEQPWHENRIATLRKAAEVYRREPDHFLPLEVYV